jgi:lipoyl(octanoyl) transferase
VDTDLNYFQYIVPCGLTKPVCSLRSVGAKVTREQAQQAIVCSFAAVFGYQLERNKMAKQELQETR